MTDHTAIIERMARAMDEVFSLPFDECPDDAKRNRITMAQAALSASGLLEVLEKAEPFDRFGKVLIEKFPSNGGHTLNGGTPEAVEITPADFAALRNAIKGVRE